LRDGFFHNCFLFGVFSMSGGSLPSPFEGETDCNSSARKELRKELKTVKKGEKTKIISLKRVLMNRKTSESSCK